MTYEEEQKKLNDTLEAFKKSLDNISDEDLDERIKKIDAMGIEGPSVEEYFAGLNEAVAVQSWFKIGEDRKDEKE